MWARPSPAFPVNLSQLLPAEPTLFLLTGFTSSLPFYGPQPECPPRGSTDENKLFSPLKKSPETGSVFWWAALQSIGKRPCVLFSNKLPMKGRKGGGGMPNNTTQSCRLFGYSPENESNFSFCHYKYFIANGTDFLQLWLSKGPLCEYLRKKKIKGEEDNEEEGRGE